MDAHVCHNVALVTRLINLSNVLIHPVCHDVGSCTELAVGNISPGETLAIRHGHLGPYSLGLLLGKSVYNFREWPHVGDLTSLNVSSGKCQGRRCGEGMLG